MPTDQLTKIAPGPAVKLDSIPINHLYVLFYRHGVNPRCEKGFIHPGDIKSANQRAQRHCEIMNYKFIFVRPMFCNIDAEEQQRMDTKNPID